MAGELGRVLTVAAQQEIHVVYLINDTICNAKFRCQDASITMGSEATVVAMIDGQDEKGNRVISAVYREAFSVTRYML